MIKVQLFYKPICEKCDEIRKILNDLKENSCTQFIFEEYNVDSQIRKENFYSKKVLVKYGTSQVPFLLFINEKKEEYAAIYNESKDITKDKISGNIINGYMKNL